MLHLYECPFGAGLCLQFSRPLKGIIQRSHKATFQFYSETEKLHNTARRWATPKTLFLKCSKASGLRIAVKATRYAGDLQADRP